MAKSNAKVYLNLETDMTKIISQIQKSVENLNDSMKKMESNNSVNKIEDGFKRSKSSIDSSNSSILNLRGSIGSTALKFAGWIGALITVKELTEKVYDFYKNGVQFNMDTQTAQIGLAGLITSLTKIKRDGKEVNGLEAFNVSTIIAQSQMKKLQIAAMKTSASLSDVTTAFQAGLSPGLANGFNVDQVREISVLIANSAKAMKMSGDQVSQELRAILSGDVNTDAQIGTSLGLGPNGALQKAYKDALQAGKGYDFLKAQLKDFAIAGEETSKTLSGTIDSAKDFFDVFSGQSSLGLTDQLTNLNKVVNSTFDVDTGKFTEGLSNISTLLNMIGEFSGSKIVEFFTYISAKTEDFGKMLGENNILLYTMQGILEIIVGIFSVAWEILKEIFSIFTDIFGAIVDSGTATDNTVNQLTTMQKVLIVVNTLILAIKILLQSLVGIVKTVADAVRTVLGGAIVLVLKSLNGIIQGFAKIANFAGMDTSGIDDFTAKFDDMIMNIGVKTVGAKNAIAQMLAGDGTQNFKDNFKEVTNTVNNLDSELQKAYGKDGKSFIKQEQEKRDALEKTKEAQQNALLSTTTVGAKNEKPKPAAKGGKGGAYNQQLSELQKFADAQKQINENANKNLDLEYQYNLVSIKNYFKLKNDLTRKDYETQKALLDEQIKLNGIDVNKYKDGKNFGKLNDKQLDLLNKRQKLEQDYQYEIKKSGLEQTKALKDYEKGLQDINNQILEMTGRSGESRTIKFKAEISDLKEKYQADPDAMKQIENYEKVKGYQESINSLKDEYNTILDHQNAKENLINAQADAGLISQIGQMNQLTDARQANIDKLQELIDKMKELAKESGNANLQADVDNMTAALIKAQSEADVVKKKFQDLFVNGLVENLNAVIEGTKSAKDAFTDFVTSIASEINKLVLTGIIKQLSTTLTGDKSGSFGFGDFMSSLFGTMGASASGGNVTAGVPRFVGETGKEVFIPKTNGFIANSEQTRALLGGQNNSNGKGIVNNINIYPKDANSFRASRNQTSAKIAAVISSAQRNR